MRKIRKVVLNEDRHTFLGKGGCGRVYKLNSRVAVKIFSWYEVANTTGQQISTKFLCNRLSSDEECKIRFQNVFEEFENMEELWNKLPDISTKPYSLCIIQDIDGKIYFGFMMEYVEGYHHKIEHSKENENCLRFIYNKLQEVGYTHDDLFRKNYIVGSNGRIVLVDYGGLLRY